MAEKEERCWYVLRHRNRKLVKVTQGNMMKGDIVCDERGIPLRIKGYRGTTKESYLNAR